MKKLKKWIKIHQKALAVILIVALIASSIFVVFVVPAQLEADDTYTTLLSDRGIKTLSDLDISFKCDEDSIPLMRDLMDAYNGFNISNSIYNDIELWGRFEMDINVQNAIKKINCSVIHDDSIRLYACNYKNQILSFLSDMAVDDSVKFAGMMREYSFFQDKLVSRYRVSHYGDLTEDKYYEIYDKNNIIQNYDSIFSLRGTNDALSIAYLEQSADEAKSFDEKCIYTLEYAHTIVDDLEHPAIKRLEDLMKSGKYSIYLYGIWRTWRCLLQHLDGPSKDATIPNDLYNRMRLVCAHTISEYILQHPSDIMAINQFLGLSATENIERYGSYPYGNQNAMEEYMLFPERFEE